MKIAGEATYIDKDGHRRTIAGMGSVSDGELESLKVSGSCEFGDLVCNDVKIEGECSGSSLKSENVTSSGTLRVKTLIVEGSLKASGSVYSDVLDAADVDMESRGGSLGEIKCGRIRVFEHGGVEINGGGLLSKIFGVHSSARSVSSRVRIKSIDADEVNLQNCEVDVIKCRDAIIGSNCVIGTLNVEGKCEVVDGSTVKETIRGGSST